MTPDELKLQNELLDDIRWTLKRKYAWANVDIGFIVSGDADKDRIAVQAIFPESGRIVEVNMQTRIRV